MNNQLEKSDITFQISLAVLKLVRDITSGGATMLAHGSTDPGGFSVKKIYLYNSIKTM